MLTRITFLKSLLVLPFAKLSNSQKTPTKKLILEAKDFERKNFQEVIKAVNFLNFDTTFKLHYIDGVITKVVKVKIKEFHFNCWKEKNFALFFYSEENPLIVLNIGENWNGQSISVFTPSRILPFSDEEYQFVAFEIIQKE